MKSWEHHLLENLSVLCWNWNNNSFAESLTFKEKKAKKLKAQAKSSHNWNVLFLGTNAVADVIASTYSTTKEQLLNDNNKSEYDFIITALHRKSTFVGTMFRSIVKV